MQSKRSTERMRPASDEDCIVKSAVFVQEYLKPRCTSGHKLQKVPCSGQLFFQGVVGKYQ